MNFIEKIVDAESTMYIDDSIKSSLESTIKIRNNQLAKFINRSRSIYWWLFLSSGILSGLGSCLGFLGGSTNNQTVTFVSATIMALASISFSIISITKATLFEEAIGLNIEYENILRRLTGKISVIKFDRINSQFDDTNDRFSIFSKSIFFT